MDMPIKKTLSQLAKEFEIANRRAEKAEDRANDLRAKASDIRAQMLAYMGDSSEESSVKDVIKETLRNSPGFKATIPEIIQQLPDRNPGTIRTSVYNMQKNNVIRRVAPGTFALVGPSM